MSPRNLRARPPAQDDEPPDVVATIRPQQPATDVGNGWRFVDLNRRDVRHIPSRGSLFFDGRRWVDDVGGGEMRERAKKTAIGILLEAHACTDDVRRSATIKWAHASGGAARIHAMIEMAQSDPRIVAKPDAFDADPMLFNCVNGTVDLRTGELRKHDRGDLLTRISPATFEPCAAAPVFREMLHRTFAGNESMIAYLQRVVGYSLTGRTDEQCLFFLYGPGCTGKSAFTELLRVLFGDYAMHAPFATFEERRSEGPRNDLARLQGARLVTAVESCEGRSLDEASVKALTGSDTITARFLNREFFEYRPQFKLMFASNHRPRIRGTDEGIWRRIRLIPFTVVVPESQRDPRLGERLRAELPGILAWAVEGCLAWQREGLGTPEEVRKATAEYREASDPLGDFLRDRCTQVAGSTTPSAELYKCYVEWARESGERELRQRDFTQRLEERGFHRVKASVMRWIGLSVRPHEREEREDMGASFGDLLREKSMGDYPNIPPTPSRSSRTTYESDEREGLRNG